jgi:hypothetical protein
MDLKLTKDRMKTFWEYGKSRVFIAILVAVALFYTLYQITRPVVPASARFDIISGGIYIEEGVASWQNDILKSVTVGQVQCNIDSLDLDSYDAGNAQTILITRMTGQEGDIFIIPYTTYSSLASSDNMVNLEAPIPGDPEGRSVLDRLKLPSTIDPETCRLTVRMPGSDGTSGSTREICGIPVETLKGLFEIGINPPDYVLCIPDYPTIDYDNIIRVIQWMVDEKQDYEPPATTVAATTPS